MSVIVRIIVHVPCQSSHTTLGKHLNWTRLDELRGSLHLCRHIDGQRRLLLVRPLLEQLRLWTRVAIRRNAGSKHDSFDSLHSWRYSLVHVASIRSFGGFGEKFDDRFRDLVSSCENEPILFCEVVHAKLLDDGVHVDSCLGLEGVEGLDGLAVELASFGVRLNFDGF